ncbi:MAG: ATP-dependent DNA helicase DinG [Moraxellaceae bacterium]|nr:MAG: ATP-dependent DNA helicase DinG [Moraxellaceae bacterium]
MLSDDIKLSIQTAYSGFLKQKGLSPRYGQRLMIAEIAKALGAIKTDGDGVRTSDNHVCVVEAGTGTGKTVAYLVSAIPMAQALGKKVVISTATVALQNQIVSKDIPDLLINSPLRFSFQLAKGRGRYLCLSQLDQLMSAGSSSDPNMALWEDLRGITVDKESSALYQALAIAVDQGKWDGDRDSWKEEIDDVVWRRVTTDHNRCTGRNCSFYDECVFYKNRGNLHKTDVIVANHDLVLADLVLGGGAILPPPEETIYIFDEGHHLPDKALGHFSLSSYMRGTLSWLTELVKLLATVADTFSNTGIHSAAEQIADPIQQLQKLLPMALTMLTPFSEQTDNYRGGFSSDGRAGYSVYRFENGVIPDELREQAKITSAETVVLRKHLMQIVDILEDGMEGNRSDINKSEAEMWYPMVGAQLARAEAVDRLWQSYCHSENNSKVPVARWLSFHEATQGLDVELCTSPILAADVLNQYLWSQCFASIVTSATIVAVGDFERFKMRTGVSNDAAFHVVPSPFDYANAGKVVIPAMDFDPSDTLRHTQFVVDYLVAEGKRIGTLVLFTSRKQLQDVYDLLPFEYQEVVLAQGQVAKAEIINRHKAAIDADEPSIIFGLASFAEGIDLPGAYCEHVVIAKLPFSVPEDPVDETLSEWIKEKGGNPFMQLAVPDAAIKLKQAVGRLLRTEMDSGKISILDRRIVTKRYGKAILNSLPPFPVEIR